MTRRPAILSEVSRASLFRRVDVLIPHFFVWTIRYSILLDHQAQNLGEGSSSAKARLSNCSWNFYSEKTTGFAECGVKVRSKIAAAAQLVISTGKFSVRKTNYTIHLIGSEDSFIARLGHGCEG